VLTARNKTTLTCKVLNHVETMNHHHSCPPSFLSSLDFRIEEHLTDAAFSVKKLLRLVGMSRTDLHRKLNKTVGMSATKYIRQVRLEKAAELFKNEPRRSVHQVAREVGFENQNYFSKQFEEVFGRRP
jgi:AraC-like DNA-binding protein